MGTDMDTSISQLEVYELITKAQAGDYESMSSLALQVQGKVTSYIYRLTLNQDVAEDLSQETLMHMVKSLRELENPEAFWSWLYRTALGKVQHYFRDTKRRKSVQMSTIDEERLSANDVEKDEVLEKAVQKELSEAMFKAMGKLKLRYRSVLSLRCYDRMPYSEVATLMECSELRARVLFYRAKYSLKKHLCSLGIGRDLLLTALGVFGVITSSTKGGTAAGAATVSVASLDVGFLATLIGAMTTKIGVYIVTAFTAAGLVVTPQGIAWTAALGFYVVFWCILLGFVGLSKY
jgi:RNA polymerase sigma-70 factor (ECF subfamily)